MADLTETLLETPLASLHRELGGKMVPFAGYAMPVQYPAGIMAEHLATRAGAALFDVSHMGQAELVGEWAAARCCCCGRAGGGKEVFGLWKRRWLEGERLFLDGRW